jgi:hypothetical protein
LLILNRYLEGHDLPVLNLTQIVDLVRILRIGLGDGYMKSLHDFILRKQMIDGRDQIGHCFVLRSWMIGEVDFNSGTPGFGSTGLPLGSELKNVRESFVVRLLLPRVRPLDEFVANPHHDEERASKIRRKNSTGQASRIWSANTIAIVLPLCANSIMTSIKQRADTFGSALDSPPTYPLQLRVQVFTKPLRVRTLLPWQAGFPSPGMHLGECPLNPPQSDWSSACQLRRGWCAVFVETRLR